MHDDDLLHSDGLVRINVQLGGRKTSISMDRLLYDELTAALAPDTKVNEWLEQERRYLDAVGGTRLRAGYSRLVQRRALRVVLGREPAYPRRPSAPEQTRTQAGSPASFSGEDAGAVVNS